MTTRLRKQAERERDRERERRTTEMISVSDGEEDAVSNVHRLFFPGGQDVAEEFRSQEIDGQALLLLTEDHLVSTMNLKLGPALKLYKHLQINKK
uniref:SAM domain-containing protein n=1 Tax=Anabas testudineus TaxID=64144 RepID=A0A3Q1JMR8_ANATE